MLSDPQHLWCCCENQEDTYNVPRIQYDKVYPHCMYLLCFNVFQAPTLMCAASSRQRATRTSSPPNAAMYAPITPSFPALCFHLSRLCSHLCQLYSLGSHSSVLFPPFSFIPIFAFCDGASVTTCVAPYRHRPLLCARCSSLPIPFTTVLPAHTIHHGSSLPIRFTTVPPYRPLLCARCSNLIWLCNNGEQASDSGAWYNSTPNLK